MVAMVPIPSEHPESARLWVSIARLRSSPCEIRHAVMRYSEERFASPAKFISGEGSGEDGGRLNPPGLSAVYSSFELVTCLAELVAAHSGMRVLPGSYRSRSDSFVIRTIDAQLCVGLDLCGEEVQAELRVNLPAIIETGWQEENRVGRETLLQAIGRIAWRQGFEGIIYPSAARPGGKNLVYFPSDKPTESRFEVRYPPQRPD